MRAVLATGGHMPPIHAVTGSRVRALGYTIHSVRNTTRCHDTHADMSANVRVSITALAPLPLPLPH